jgi:uncharacterized protein YggE
MYRRWWHVTLAVLAVLTLAACGGLAQLRGTAVAESPAAVEDEAGESPVAVAPSSERPEVVAGGGGGVVVNGVPTQGLVVVGTGSASAEPQVAEVNFGVDLRGGDPAAIVDEAAQKMDRALAAVRQLGVADEDVQTTGYSLWVETVYDPEKGTPTGEVIYHVSHFVQVTLRKPSEVGSLLAAVVAAGANTVSGVSFTVEDPQALVEEAREKALLDAKARAQAMATTLGIELGKPMLVTETGYSVPFLDRGGMGGGGMAEVAAPSVAPGAFSVSISVQVIYEIR